MYSASRIRAASSLQGSKRTKEIKRNLHDIYNSEPAGSITQPATSTCFLIDFLPLYLPLTAKRSKICAAVQHMAECSTPTRSGYGMVFTYAIFWMSIF